jgi:cysteinyl-tRNA synthetase
MTSATPQTSLRIFNTESGHKEPFEPLRLPVKMYVCGLTPKNEAHLGHGRLFIFNDTVRRYLAYRGYPVTYVQNFTDIDDKIIAAGLREGIAPSLAAQRYTEAYFRDMDRLGVQRADNFTYVTEYIPRIIAMVQGLIERGHAYVLDGDVYFSVPTFPRYGKLSGRGEAEATLDEAYKRIEPDERKHDPRDFALWKAAKSGEPWWESPWGKGRPGWHIECSTMAMEALGPQIDIHGGGTDLIFPHHENEITQSESFTGVAPFARYWLHTGMLTLGVEKMAHSGRYVTIRSALESGVPAPALRTYLLSRYYRANQEYSEEQVRATVTRWRRWAETRARLLRLLDWTRAQPAGQSAVASSAGSTSAASETGREAAPREHLTEHLTEHLAQARGDFVAAMDDDFNTARALAVIDDLVHRANDYADRLGEDAATPATAEALQEALGALDELTGVLGIALVDSEAAAPALDEATRAEIERLVQRRGDARARRDWPEADRLRQELDTRYHVVIKDTPQGPTWTVRE